MTVTSAVTSISARSRSGRTASLSRSTAALCVLPPTRAMATTPTSGCAELEVDRYTLALPVAVANGFRPVAAPELFRAHHEVFVFPAGRVVRQSATCGVGQLGLGRLVSHTGVICRPSG